MKMNAFKLQKPNPKQIIKMDIEKKKFDEMINNIKPFINEKTTIITQPNIKWDVSY